MNTPKTSVPKYIRDILARSEWAVEAGRLPEGGDPGYTILIHKRTAYARAKTLDGETRLLRSWAERLMRRLFPGYDPAAQPKTVIHQCPTETHYWDQWATVTIWDPVMKYIEEYIPTKKRPPLK